MCTLIAPGGVLYQTHNHNNTMHRYGVTAYEVVSGTVYKEKVYGSVLSIVYSIVCEHRVWHCRSLLG
jgi:hypothetical protein